MVAGKAPLHRAPPDGGNVPDSEQVGAIAPQPTLGELQQRLRLGRALGHGRFGDDIARVLDKVTLLAKGLEHDHGFGRNAEGLRQRLESGLVMAGAARERPEAVRVEARIGNHSNGGIRGAEASLRANSRGPCVGQQATGAGEQARDRVARRCRLVEARPHQVPQAHPLSP